jgi:hypothetical protein
VHEVDGLLQYFGDLYIKCSLIKNAALTGVRNAARSVLTAQRIEM